MLVGMAAIFGAVEDKKHCYTTAALRLNEWGLAGGGGPSAKNMRG
jgi:hypothetical protein